MKREMKKMLRDAYEAPAPAGKKDFLRKYRHRPEIDMLTFIITQISYLRKRTWVLWTALFLCGLFAGSFAGEKADWIFASLTPFLAVSAVAESMRSGEFGMEELELSCCFSLKSVLFARMAIMGPVHLTLLTGLIFAGTGGAFTLFQSGVNLLIPYFLTTVICLTITRKVRSREGTYLCMAAAVLVGGLHDMAKYGGFIRYSAQSGSMWLGALIILTVMSVREYLKMMEETEELTWKLL